MEALTNVPLDHLDSDHSGDAGRDAAEPVVTRIAEPVSRITNVLIYRSFLDRREQREAAYVAPAGDCG